MNGGRLRRAVRVLGLGSLFVVTFVLATALHVGLSPGRRVAGRALRMFLDHTFLGSFEVGVVSELSPACVAVERFVARDPSGRVVLDASGVRARAYLLAIAREFLKNDGKTTIVIEYTRVERAKVTLAPEATTGDLGIAAAFTPRPTPPKPSAPPGKPVRVWFGHAEIGEGAVHAELPGVPPLDGRVTGVQGQVLVSPVGVAVDAARFSAVVHGLLAQDIRAVGTFHQRGTTHFWSTLDGYAGDLQFDSIARLDGKHLALKLDVPRGDPAVVRALLPSWPLYQSASAAVDAAGDLPELQATASATVGNAALTGHGTLSFSPELRLALSAHGDDIDLRAVFPSVPETRVSADVELGLSSSERGVELTTQGTTRPAIVAGVPVPGTKFDASYDPNGLAGRAELYEPGMPLSGTFALRDGTFSADVHAPRFELSRAPRLAKFFAASGAAEFRAKAKINQNKLDATLALDLDHVTAGAGSLGSAHVAAHAAGPLATPKALRLDGSVDGRALRFAELRFDSLNAKVNGSLSKLAVTAKLMGARGTSIQASSRVSPLGATRFDDVDVTLSREATTLHAMAEHVTLTPDAIELADVRVEGAGGKLTGSARYRPTLLEVNARGERLDLAAITRVFGFAGRRVRGKLDFTADVALAHDVRRGSLDLTLRDGAAGPLAGVNLDWSTALERENLEGSALLDVEGLGRARLTFDTRVEGSLLDANAWRAATGHGDLGLERLELGRVSPLLPRAWELEALTGTVAAQVMVERETAAEAPSIVLVGGTKGLGVTRHAPGSEPLVVNGLDLQLSADADPKRDFMLADLRVLDEHGLFAAASGRLDVGVTPLFERPRTTWPGVRTAPVVATLVVDDRSLDQLPPPLRPEGVLGTLRLELGVRGTLDEPRLSAKAAVARLAFGDAPEVVPFDACATLQYDPAAQRAGLGLQAYLGGTGRACSGTRVAVASATASVDPKALARGERGVSGEAQVGFEDFPLELVPPLAAAGVVGRVRGAAALTDVSGAPAMNARLSLADVSVHKIAVGAGDFTLRTQGTSLAASLKLERAGGTLDAEADAALDWSGNVPRFAATEPLGVRAEFHDMDASILLPAVGDVLGDLSGRLDGNVALTLAGSQAKPGATNDLSGNFTLQDGSLQISGLEMRLSKLGFAASASRVGDRTVVAVRELSAASGSKYPNVAGTADLYFSGVKLVDVRANANLRRVPLMIQGVSQANLTGSAGVEVFPDRDPILVAIQLHDLTAALPRTSGRGVLSVDDNPDITVAQPLREPLRTSKGNGPSFRLAFDLARKVRVTRADMEIPLHGRPVIDLGAETHVHGDLELDPGGRAQLLGKGFVIESGEVHFDTADPADPHLRVLASWRAPDGTTVYVDVGGTVRQATLRLESDPALPQADIQALLLGGGAGAGDSSQAQAAGLGYGADFVGQLLADTPLQRIELRTGTETTADDVSYSTYSAAVPVSENVWVELAYKNLETGGATEQRDAASAIVDWRFKRDWSLRTEAGTVGAGLDMLWQYRY